jgi:hypothetical protein
MLVNMADGMCLDANAGMVGDASQEVQGWQCNGGLNQSWNLSESDAETVFVSDESAPAGEQYCLDGDTVTATQNPQKIQAWWTCNYQQQQQWAPTTPLT